MDWKKLEKEKRILNGINGLTGKYSCLDNNYPLDNEISIYLPFQSKNSKLYSCNNIELLYEACKCYKHEDIELILRSNDINTAKILMKTISLRKDFNRIKIKVLKELLNKKFLNCDIFRNTLLNIPYNQYIVRFNDYKDKYFGVCNKTMIGKNILGELLTKLKIKRRKELLEFKKYLREFIKTNKGYMFIKNANGKYEKLQYDIDYISNNINEVALTEFCKLNNLKYDDYKWILEVV